MEARKRTRSRATAAGRNLENDLVEALNAQGLKADRLRLKGSKDEGDVRAYLATEHVFECKNTRTLSLSQWWKEAQRECVNANGKYAWVVLKRHGVSDPNGQWALCDVGQLATLLREIVDLREQVNRTVESRI